MDLGIKGRHALVCGGSRGLGEACARSLAKEGANLTIVARGAEALEEAAARLRAETGVAVQIVAADVNTEEGRDAILAACPAPDILVCNPGVRQVPGNFREWDRAEWLYWWDVHFHSSMELIRRTTPGMCERKFGRVVSISVSFIKFPQIGFAHSHAARVALSGAIGSIARELIPHNVTVNTVCPGLFDTDALRTNLHGHAARRGTTYEAMVEDRIAGCPAGRFADPSECGDLVAYLCSAQAGFMTAQNIVNDGGVYQGLF
ncbi:SDR family oxidoreductase [Falsiroseomonas tokyonensis]|uniref:SDR family oxidoreductase n=1 Tax=Falsiroseomonas tokyonensis TaxID=430521 RepID=A0ABV7BWH1_9PROT|nr:SDR family oxidoreductase [Falsiroseomonas tokyonensis]MBU8538531.1 SDR family oxidoreductase [Falsiroseomonas tokyonensis]